MADRQSNIELVRIIAMIMVIACHANDAIGPYCSYSENPSVFDWLRLFFQASCMVCVNAFIMISGWFGIKPSIRGIVSIFFQLAFYSILISVLYAIFGHTNVSIKDTIVSCLGFSYWFIPSYLILYALSPILNSYLNNTERKDLLITLLLFYSLQFLYGRFGDHGHFITGHSVISFIGLYLTAGFIKHFSYRLDSVSPAWLFTLYLACTLALSFIGYFIGGSTLDGTHSIFHYNHPIVLLSSVSFFLFFTKLSFQSKAINWLAASSFAIYLIHMNYLVRVDFVQFMRWISHIYQPASSFGLLLLSVLLISLASIFVDKIRILTWNPIGRIFKNRLK